MGGEPRASGAPIIEDSTWPDFAVDSVASTMMLWKVENMAHGKIIVISSYVYPPLQQLYPLPIPSAAHVFSLISANLDFGMG